MKKYYFALFFALMIVSLISKEVMAGQDKIRQNAPQMSKPELSRPQPKRSLNNGQLNRPARSTSAPQLNREPMKAQTKMQNRKITAEDRVQERQQGKIDLRQQAKESKEKKEKVEEAVDNAKQKYEDWAEQNPEKAKELEDAAEKAKEKTKDAAEQFAENHPKIADLVKDYRNATPLEKARMREQLKQGLQETADNLAAQYEQWRNDPATQQKIDDFKDLAAAYKSGDQQSIDQELSELEQKYPKFYDYLEDMNEKAKEWAESHSQ